MRIVSFAVAAAVAVAGLSLPIVSANAQSAAIVVKTGDNHHHYRRHHEKKVVVIKHRRHRDHDHH